MLIVELEHLSDPLLADIGVQRRDIRRFVNAAVSGGTMPESPPQRMAGDEPNRAAVWARAFLLQLPH